MVTAYSQVKKVAMPYLQAYSEDVSKYDRKVLNHYKGNFLYAMRESGTNILTEKSVKHLTSDEFDNAVLWLVGHNKRFFVYHSGSLREVKLSEFKDKIVDYSKKIGWRRFSDERSYEYFEQLKTGVSVGMKAEDGFRVGGWKVYVKKDFSVVNEKSFDSRNGAIKAVALLRDKYSEAKQ